MNISLLTVLSTYTRLLNAIGFFILVGIIVPTTVFAQWPLGNFEPSWQRQERLERERKQKELSDWQLQQQYQQMQQQKTAEEETFKCQNIISYTSPACPDGGQATVSQRVEYVVRYKQIFSSLAEYSAQWQQEVREGKRTQQSLKDAVDSFLARVEQDIQAQKFPQLANQGANQAASEMFRNKIR